MAALVAAGSVVLLVNYISTHSAPPVVTSSTASTPTTRVVVATAALTAGDQLTTANVGLASYPTSALPADSSTYYTDVSKLLSPAQYVSSQLPKGTLILSTLLVATPNSGPTVSQPPIDIQNEGDVAISIPYSESNGAGGYIQPEDHIDILVDEGGVVRYAFQDVRVIKVGGRAEQGGSGSPNLLLIELKREQAAALLYLTQNGTTISYAIRPHNEYGKGSLPNSAPVSGSNWTTFLDG